LQFYDAATGKPDPSRSPVRQGGPSQAFSPDGKWLAGATYEGVCVWDVAKGKKLHEFPIFRPKGNPGGQVWRVSFSPDGKHLAGAFHCSGAPHELEGPMVRVWNMTNGKEVFSARDTAHASTNAVAFSRNGKYLAFDAGEGFVEVHEWVRKKRLARFQ